MSEHDSTITLLGESLDVEEQRYEQCPECGHAGKLSLKRSAEGLLYYCLRATCGLKGFIGTTRIFPPTTKGTPKRSKEFTGRTDMLRPGQRRFFSDRFELSPGVLELFGVRWAPEKGAYVFPVRNAMGYDRGVMLRYYEGPGPKTVAYPSKAEAPWQAWYAMRRPVVRPERLLIVEDQVSAMKMATFCPTVALLGTSLSTAAALEIAETQPGEVIIALDYDATAQAHRIAEAYALLFRRVSVWALHKDLKDTTYAELREIGL